MTTDNVNRPIAIVLDDIVYSAPNVNGPIEGGNSEISGNFTVEEAQDLANILKIGKIDAPAKIVAGTNGRSNTWARCSEWWCNGIYYFIYCDFYFNA